jgi:methyltransferase (TIGR00027 family)
MEAGQPSRTARSAATHRAVHQILEAGKVFFDPLAITILGEEEEALVQKALEDPDARSMRLFVTARARSAEDALAALVPLGVRQVVILGAGLDTFAYRQNLPGDMRVFEVDHPETQAWKRLRLAAAGIAAPQNLSYVALDFASNALEKALLAQGWTDSEPTFFSWLGVVIYLARPAIWETLSWIARLPAGAEVVFDYSEPPESLDLPARLIHRRRAQRVRALGESWVSFFEPASLVSDLHGIGIDTLDDVDARALARRYLGLPPSSGGRSGAHIVRARSQTLRCASR